jgi:hypothetical protein
VGPEGRPWYREPETFVAVAALIVSVSAVAVGIYEAALQRRHDRAEVWPHVEITTFVMPNGAALAVENTGIGPAIIKSMTVTVDGRPTRNWNDVLRALLGHDPGPFSNSTIAERALRPGDKVTVLGLPHEDLPADFWKSISRVSISICYASVFDEYWLVRDARIGGQTAWQNVTSCPGQPAGTDY